MSIPTKSKQTDPTPKNLTILYFASLAEQADKDEENFSFSGDSLSELYQQLSQHYHFDLPQTKLAVAINHEIVNWQTTIHDRDIIAFIPPVAGG